MAGIYINIEDSGIHLGLRRSKIKAVQDYAQAMCQELRFYAESLGKNETIETLYVGGALHLVPRDILSTIIEAVFVHFDASPIQEVTADLEPHAVQNDALVHLQTLGFNRINILARSFFDEDLKKLECTYRSKDVHELIECVQGHGFKKLSLELSYDIDEQPFEYWAANLEKVVYRNITHVSVRSHKEHALVEMPRQLTCCFFFPELSDVMIQRFSFAMEYLNESGLDQYLFMDFATEESQCRHYLLHAYQSNILGVGPGAHSFWWHGPSHTKAHRWSNVDNIERYISLLKQREYPIEARSACNLDELANEHIMLMLQTEQGIHTEILESDYGVDLYSEKIEELAWLESECWIHPVRNNRIRLTPLGRVNSYHLIPKLLLK